MGIQCDWNRGREQRSSVESWCQPDNGDGNSCSWINRSNRRSNRRNDKFIRLLRSIKCRNVYNIKSWRSLSIYPDIFWTRNDQPDDHTKSNHRSKCDRRNVNVYPIRYGKRILRTAAAFSITSASILSGSPALAESVGGVSATANPIANSSGSVTNQAIQVLQGPYVTNTYGNQISCQGPTANFTPYIQYSNSWKDPFERTYMEPQYNNTDFTGRTTQQTVTVKNYPWEDWYDTRTYTNADGETVRAFEDGADMQITVDVDGPDGIPDNPGEVIWEKPVRTDMTANNNFNLGLSATLSLPLDKKLQKLCKLAATTQIEQQRQLTANKRLDFEIARLKNCGELMKQGIMFHPKSPYASICADVVVVTPPGKILPHSHDLPQLNLSSETPSSSQIPSSSSQTVNAASQNLSATSPSSPDTDSPEVQPESDGKESSQVSSGWFRWPFSRQASPPSEVDQPAALLGGPIQLPPSQSLP